MVRFLHKDDDRACGVINLEGTEPIQWSAIQNNSKWYVLIHSEIKEDYTISLKCILNMIQNSLKYKMAA